MSQNRDDPSSSNPNLEEVVISPPSSTYRGKEKKLKEKTYMNVRRWNSVSTRSCFRETGDEPSSSNFKEGAISLSPSDPIFRQRREQFIRFLCGDDWESAKSLHEEFPDMAREVITDVYGDGVTALHHAVILNRLNFVKGLVNLADNKDLLEKRNLDGNTAFCVAVILGNVDFVEIMLEKNFDLLLIRGQDERLPIHLAVAADDQKIVEYLFHQMDFGHDFKDTERLFFMTINKNMYLVAWKLVAEYPTPLSTSRDDENNLTALHMLARKPPSEHVDPSRIQQTLIETIWDEVKQLERNKRLELITEPSVVLFDAVKSENINFLKWVDYAAPEISGIKDPKNGQTLMHILVLHRLEVILKPILKSWNEGLGRWNVGLMIREVDNDHNNVLHFAALQLKEESLTFRPDIQMRRELEWFQEMKNSVPPELRMMRNNHGQTPDDMFNANHRKLSNEIKSTAEAVANAGMVVAALIVAVAFAAALTIPGGKTNAWFVVFIMANAAALFTSVLSIVGFLSIFTSSKYKNDFVTSLYPNLIFGKKLLFISLVTMIIAFAATSFLIFDGKYKWAAYVVTSSGLLTIIMSLQLQLGIFDDLLEYFSSRCIKPCLQSIQIRKLFS